MTQFSYTAMATSYINGLTALASVSVTVLALILALDMRRHNVQILKHVVASLTMAMVTCIVTSQLMSKTSAVIVPNPPATASDLRLEYMVTFKSSGYSSKKLAGNTAYLTLKPLMPIRSHPVTPSDSGVQRLFLLASSGAFISISLFLFGLLLVPIVYKVDGFPQNLTLWAFNAIQSVAWLWQIGIVWREWQNYFHIIVFISVVAAGIWLGRNYTARYPRLPYAACVSAIIVVSVYYMLTMLKSSPVLPADVVTYAAATSFGPALVLGACWMFHAMQAKLPAAAASAT